MPGLDDPYAQPIDLYGAPDPASLRWPWDPPLDPTPAAPPPAPAADQSALAPQQPGLGLPTQAVDVAAPQLGPPLEADAPPAPAPPLPDIAPEQLFAPGAVPPAPDAGPPALYGPPISPSELHYQQAVSDHAGQPLAIPDHAEQARAIGSLDAVGFAQLDAQHERDRAAFVEQRRRAATDAYIAGEKQALADRQIANRHAQERSDALIADATRIANTKVDPSGGVHGARLIAGVLASIVGGLVQGRTGSAHNAGLDALMQTINNGIEAQKADLANQREGIGLRRGALADEYARTGHLQDAEDRVRLSSLKLADDMLASDAQNWDPRGTTAINNERLRRGINGQMAAVVDGQRQRDLENSLKISKERREAELAANTIRHDRASEFLQSRTLVSAAADRKAAIDARREDKAAEAADRAATLAEKNIRERSVGGEVIPVKDAGGNVVGSELGKMMMADGKTVFQANGTEATITAFQKKHDAALKLLGTLDEIRRIGPEWLSGTANSDKYQRLTQLMGQARLQAIAANDLGVPTGHDIELAENFLGSSDVTRRKDSLAGLMQARESLVRDHNIELHARGLDKEWNPPDLAGIPAASNTTEDDRKQSLIEKPNGGFEREFTAELARRSIGLSPDEARAFGPHIDPDEFRLNGYKLPALRGESGPPTTRTPLTTAQHAVFDEVARSYDPDISLEQRRGIGELGIAAHGDGPEAASARAQLQEIVSRGQTGKLRDLAGSVLAQAGRAAIESPPIAPTDRAVAHETLPGAR